MDGFDDCTKEVLPEQSDESNDEEREHLIIK